MDRRLFGKRIAASGAAVGVAAFRGPLGFAQEDTEGLQSRTLEFDKPIPLSLQSAGVEWRGATFHLLRLGQIRFALDRDAGRLTAVLKGSVTTFDRVDYEVGAAILGPNGRLLGVARATCPVERVWLGKPLNLVKEISMDFGTSLDFAMAERFSLAISRCNVLTPDQWQEEAK